MSATYRAPRLHIDGRWCEGEHAADFELVNPANRQVLDRLRLASREQIDLALQAAQKGFEAWQRVAARRICKKPCSRTPAVGGPSCASRASRPIEMRQAAAWATVTP